MAEYCDSEPSLFGPEEPICPYTGLRTFTEEEAIYFRGREAHVEKCLALLADKRFVMITGSSGDGKSSLVFAGLLPEIRAGFLRGRYSNWAVATFRPERSPLRNMARAVATALRLESSEAAVETELEQGFSALAQLYQASSLCPPTELPAETTVQEKRQRQMQAANLLLVVDQFEEFFTNPENYSGNGPNTAAQTVVNLLLETVQLAHAANLPIYIVCTMRSDFVGQCAEFRGLIEQIGVSQYFVPRLLRHEFVEVIKEPALLSGNRISERLVQRLLYDMHNGQDQLPVLQHALRRIWLAANEGREEMDLLHYAMVGGLSDELPAADQQRFAAWQSSISVHQRQFLLANPSLRNVLDAHANQLYYEAEARYNQTFQPPLPPGRVEQIIEQTFRLLTRTNGQRVVRNRLTGAEITAILNDPLLSWPVVCQVLRPFREAGTTFLSPFLLGEEDDQEVPPPDTVLDITHESLIRNWNHLTEWANSEASDVSTAQDLMQQADRWQANAENAGFLLPIGPYMYFSQWKRRKKVSASWLAHYVASGPSATHRQEQAAEQSTILTRFLAASRRRLFVPLMVARYGLGRLIAGVLLPVLLVGLGWLTWSARQKRADYVAYSIIKQRTPFLASPYVSMESKARFLIDTDRLKKFVYQPWFGSHDSAFYAFPQKLDALKDPDLALNIELAMFRWTNNEHYDWAERGHPWTRRLLLDLDRRLTKAGSILVPPNGQPALSAYQRKLAVCTSRTIMAITYYESYAALHLAQGAQLRTPLPADLQRLTAIKQKLLLRLREYAQREVTTTTGAAPNPVDFGFCLRVLLGQGNYSPVELRFLDNLNPLTPGSAAHQQFVRFFPPALNLYANGGSIEHSGGYQTAAIIFAAQKRVPQVMQCLDSLYRQSANLNDANGGIALIPYFVKYELFTPANVYSLLHRSSKIGGFSFNELYAATAYSLLSVSPGSRVYIVNPLFPAVENVETDAIHLGAVNPDRLNLDRVSFSIPNAVRDRVWATLAKATPAIAAAEPLFIEKTAHNATHYPRNKAFLEAFLAKARGIYLAEIKHDSAAATQSFGEFSQALEKLRSLRSGQEAINSFQWDLGAAEAIQMSQTSSVAQDPIHYLQQPTRPKTLMFEAYYTCAFDSFFLYELRRATASQTSDPSVVQQLDSIAFREAALPDRASGISWFSLRTAALQRRREDEPNLTWIRAIALESLAGDKARTQRNTFLYTISAALRDKDRLRQLKLEQDILPFVRQLGRQPLFSQVPLQVALSDLATALAHTGRVQEAFMLATALPAPLPTITKIRAGEQVMFTNNQREQARLDKFLTAYQRLVQQKPAAAAGSSISLFYWRPHKRRKEDSLEQTAVFLTRETIPPDEASNLHYMAIGRSLADNSYQAVQDAPVYTQQNEQQLYFDLILTGLAHLHTTRPDDGWHTYDDFVLLNLTNDYDGPVD
ncbi:hypothetical protein MTX78_23160 (plasmid) [Hymenobacter tibetensis]|uniref:Novel STAND NTPase 1 domain-containing protein n=1 Tax=Hymenobacter tibetensis TaxID=497967 RepID=A0ABY4D472_9BACT|nr:hypothetical protein [Hymenobacter tibetensis]UOG77329.1 hypothetical protein MTX78_23160 [Hymenobacter tibetensis]